MEKSKTERIKELLGEDLVKDLTKLVNTIEDNPIKTTKNNYGNYMQLLSKFGNNANKVAVVLVMLGANKIGVSDALKIIEGTSINPIDNILGGV